MDVQFSPSPHPASLPIDELRKACRWERVRRSGPGGQHRNKVETGVVISHRPTGLRGEATERRSQADNLRQAIQRLRVKLALQVRSVQEGEPPSPPSPIWAARVRSSRIVVSSEHEDYPAILAEALDVVCLARFDLAMAASRLGVTSSQLQKFLRAESDAWQWVQDERVACGLPRIR